MVRLVRLVFPTVALLGAETVCSLQMKVVPTYSAPPKLPELQLTADETRLQETHLDVQTDTRGISRGASPPAIKVVNDAFEIICQDWMHGFEVQHSRNEFLGLHDQLRNLYNEELPLEFFLPGFPAKSQNRQKVLDPHADFSEFLALRNILSTMRKLERIWPHKAVKFVIFSDFHTFKDCVFVKSEDYDRYHKGLKDLISSKDLGGGADLIEVRSLKSYSAFKTTPQEELFDSLREKYGEVGFRQNFDQRVAADAAFRSKYLGVKAFMENDLQGVLPVRPKSARRAMLKEIARSMMEQGVALDNFLKAAHHDHDHNEGCAPHFIRLSIHAHNPDSGKLAIDLYKIRENSGLKASQGQNSQDTRAHFLRTPWHNAICLDARVGGSGTMEVNAVSKFVGATFAENARRLITIEYDHKPWLLLLVSSDEDCEVISRLSLKFRLKRPGSDVQIIYNPEEAPNAPIQSHTLIPKKLEETLIKHFGSVSVLCSRKC